MIGAGFVTPGGPVVVGEGFVPAEAVAAVPLIDGVVESRMMKPEPVDRV